MKIIKTNIINSLENRNHLLDGWRGIAILFVLQAHFFPNHYIHTGRFGVDIFFVLSGLLMSNILFVKRTPLLLFYKRRFSRIFPAFFVYASVIYLFSFFTNVLEYKNYFYTLTFLRTYLPVDSIFWGAPLPINHFWSLNVEEHSYILLSLISIISFFKYKEHIPLIFIGLSTFVMFYIYGRSPPSLTEIFYIRTEVAAGALILSAGYYLVHHKVAKYIRDWMLIVAFILALMGYSVYLPWYFSHLLSPLLLTFCVNHLSLLPDKIKNLVSNKIFIQFGIWSYSIYLWQQIPFYYGEKYGILRADKYFLTLVLLACGILMGIISYYLIENPARNYINNKSSKVTLPTAVSNVI